MFRMRDQLFISYAIEDTAFVRWLALKLSAFGYRVWWDREQLRGGAAFATEIDQAIKTSAFRVLAVLSHYSSHKPSPEAERSLALALGKERGEGFLIPLNIELKASELPWNVSNLTFIPFMDNWAFGLRQLLDALRLADAPRYPAESDALVRLNLSQPDFIADTTEDVWLNVFQLSQVPLGISRYEWTEDVPDEDLQSWVHHRQGPRTCWAFEAPPVRPGAGKPARDQYALSQISNWIDGVNLNHVTTALLRQYVENRCRSRGLTELRESSLFYFPDTLSVASRLPFTLPNGRQTWMQPIGARRIWQRGQPEQVRYHLAFSFKVELNRLGYPSLQIRPTVHFTTLTGSPVDNARNVRRAKAVRRTWFNDKWLARVAAIGFYLAEGGPSWKLCTSLPTSISGIPMRLRSSPTLDEGMRAAALKVDESEEIEETDLHLEDEEGLDGDE